MWQRYDASSTNEDGNNPEDEHSERAHGENDFGLGWPMLTNQGGFKVGTEKFAFSFFGFGGDFDLFGV